MKDLLTKLKRPMLMALAVALTFTFTSCEDEEDTKTIVDIAVENGFTVLAAALTEADLVDDLERTGPFTVFAPTDAAFSAAGINATNVSSVVGLESILKYHVLSGEVLSSELSSGEVTMLSGAKVVIDAAELMVNDANIVSPFDVDADNGVVHTIDAVLTPPENIVQTAIGAGYNVLAAGLVAAGLDDDLQGAGPFTVFAPTDAAFNAAGITAENIGEVAGLAEILQYHVVSGKVMSTDLTNSDVNTLLGQTIAIDADNLTVNELAIASPFDVYATNGVIHTISGVLIPEFDLVTSAQFYGYNVLAAALTEADLIDDLQGAGPFTVFAPTDAAFNAAGITAANVSAVENLENILLYHVLSGAVTSDMLSTDMIEMLSGKYASLDAENLMIDNADIISPIDVAATNGVIHTIDEVLMPMNNVIEAAAATSSLSTLVSILGDFPEIVSALEDETGTFTVFAPTNDAFTALLAAIGQTSAGDIPMDVLESILKYHVLASKVMSTDLSDNLTATTLNTEDITVTMVDGAYLISNTGINTADVSVSNGVVHIMDGVLVPPSMLPFLGTIVEPAYFNKNFTTLIDAVLAASPSILQTLLGDGPGSNGMTLFAPTNAAFEAAGITSLPDQATLDAVLTYHLIDGVVKSTDLPSTNAAAPAAIETVNGDFYLTNKGDGVYINGKTMVTAVDIDPSEGAGTANGVVHVIDQTLLPPSEDIVALAIAGGFSELAAALTEAGLVSTLQGDGPFTVFAPTDAAFDALYAALEVSGPTEVDDATLEAVLLYHVLGARVFSSDLEDNISATTLSSGATFTVNIDQSGVSLTDAAGETAGVTGTDVLGTNGVIHVIDKVILPTAK